MIFLPRCYLEKYILDQELPGVEVGTGVTIKGHGRKFDDYSCVFCCCWSNFMESRLLGEISITLDMQRTPPLWQKVKRNLKAS